MSCGTIEQDGQVTHMIAAGGRSSNWPPISYLKTVLIYDVKEDTWTAGITE